MLHNPFYGGAYAWGRRATGRLARRAAGKRARRFRQPEDARVFIRDHHEGYLDWAAFEENQRMIRRNDYRGDSDESVGAVRQATAC